jgi:hypothetical protein
MSSKRFYELAGTPNRDNLDVLVKQQNVFNPQKLENVLRGKDIDFFRRVKNLKAVMPIVEVLLGGETTRYEGCRRPGGPRMDVIVSLVAAGIVRDDSGPAVAKVFLSRCHRGRCSAW